MCKRLQSARFSQYPKNEVAEFYARSGLMDSYIPEPEFLKEEKAVSDAPPALPFLC